MQEPYPFVRVRSAVQCPQNHTSLARISIKYGHCCHPNCGESASPINIQKFGNLYVKIASPEPPASQSSFALTMDDLVEIDRQGRSDPQETTTRMQRGVDTIFDLDDLFPETTFDEEVIGGYHAQKAHSWVVETFSQLCQDANNTFFNCTVIRDALGTNGERFLFHQETDSSKRASEIASEYVAYCIHEATEDRSFLFESETWPSLNEIQSTLEEVPDDERSARRKC